MTKKYLTTLQQQDVSKLYLATVQQHNMSKQGFIPPLSIIIKSYFKLLFNTFHLNLNF